jgi:hypothetical protein
VFFSKSRNGDLRFLKTDGTYTDLALRLTRTSQLLGTTTKVQRNEVYELNSTSDTSGHNIHLRTDNEPPQKRMNMNCTGLKPINQAHSIMKTHEALGSVETPQGHGRQRQQLIPGGLVGGDAESSDLKSLLEDSEESKQEKHSIGTVQHGNGSVDHLISRQHIEEVSSLQSLVRSFLTFFLQSGLVPCVPTTKTSHLNTVAPNNNTARQEQSYHSINGEIQPSRKRKYTSPIPFKPMNELRCEERVYVPSSSYHEGMECDEHINVASTGHNPENSASKTYLDLVGLPEKSFAAVDQSGYTREKSTSKDHLEKQQVEKSIIWQSIVNERIKNKQLELTKIKKRKELFVSRSFSCLWTIC